MPVIPRHSPSRGSTRNASACWALLLLATLALLLSLPVPTHAAEPYCVSPQSLQLDFGTITSTSYKDARTTLDVTCGGSTTNLITPIVMRLCMFIGEGTPSGMAPRRLTDGNGGYLNYDLYANANRSQLIGPLGSNHPIYSTVINLKPAQILVVPFEIFARIPAGQNPSATSTYRGAPYNSVVRYSYGFVHTPSESDCRDGRPGTLGGTGSTAFHWSGVDARIANTCRITTATDLDFGSVGSLTQAQDQTSVIKVKCAANSNWRVTLNNGANALAGARYMASGSTRIGYELYRDAGRLQRWGSTTATGVSGNSAEQSLTVYGRIPAAANTVSGSYRDVITVTLTY